MKSEMKAARKTAKAVLVVMLLATAIHGQGRLDPAALLKPSTDFVADGNGDYSGRRFSTLATVNSSNVQALSLGWVHRLNAGIGQAGGGGSTVSTIKGTPVVVNGVMYVTIPDHVWAIDARSGREIWHSTWRSKGGWHIGNRGVAVLGSTVYVETPDCNLVALNIRDGQENGGPRFAIRAVLLRFVAPLIEESRDRRGDGDDLTFRLPRSA